jgi:hypothetical protein
MSSCGQKFFDADQDVSFFIDHCGIGLDRAAPVSDWMPGAQIEDKGVQRTNNLLCTDKTVCQRASFVRARGFGRKDIRVSCVEDGYRLAANLEDPPFAARNFCKAAKIYDETAK